MHIGPDAALIEFGSGTSTKTRELLDQLEKPAAYVPVDISRDHLFEAAGALARDYPALRIDAGVRRLHAAVRSACRTSHAARRRVVYFPGSTLGNFDPDAGAAACCTTMRQIIGTNGAVLIGIDLKKDPRVLERAYNDRAGVTAEFNLNALRHMNRELGADFDLDAFEHTALWVENQSRIEMHLVSKRDQVVHVGDEDVRIEQAASTCAPSSATSTRSKASRNSRPPPASAVSRVWMDPAKKFSVQLLEPRSLQ